MLLAATMLVFTNVVLRYFGYAIFWAEEGTRYIIAWLTFVGGSLCAKHGEHVGIDLINQVIPQKVTKYVVFVAQIIASIFMFIFVYYGWLLTYSTIQTGQITTGIMMPMWIAYICIPIGSLL
ncbi:MAG TPA: TRAP transporter small permease, partial [Bacillota bacterium]|nr:TRAP transporter small permease [Bacillota bacterium]